MQRKITGLIVLCACALFSILLGGGYDAHSSKNQETPSSRSQGEKEFLNFSGRKKKLPRVLEEVSFIAVGDISFSRGVERIIKKQQDPDYPFVKLHDYLKSADLVFGNLETPITAGPEIPDYEMIFRSNPDAAQALKRAGFSVLSLANNHTPNFGEKGLNDTFSYLANAGIQYVGAGKNEQEANQPVYMEAKGIKFAFLAYNDSNVVPASYGASAHRAGTAFMRTERMAESVKEAKKKADFVIVSMHAGIEYAGTPNDSQVHFAHAAIDAGADLIIGHHPHVVQALEKYKGKYIFYSVGNFVFDQPQSQATKEGLAVKVYFAKDGIHKISLLPVVMENLAQPRMASKAESEKILRSLQFSLARQSVYASTGGNGNFARESRGVIYAKRSKNNRIICRQEQADLDKDSIPEKYVLKNGRLAITENSKIIWESLNNWWIDNFVLADSNNDGIADLNLSLWKSGNFGRSKPFWVKKNDMSVKNHFFMLDFVGGEMKQVWGSSNLGAPNREFQIADIDNDGKNDLVVIEGNYSQNTERSGNYVAVWKWNDWGFSNEWRSEKGNFSNLEIEKNDGKSYIVVDTF